MEKRWARWGAVWFFRCIEDSQTVTMNKNIHIESNFCQIVLCAEINSKTSPSRLANSFDRRRCTGCSGYNRIFNILHRTFRDPSTILHIRPIHKKNHHQSESINVMQRQNITTVTLVVCNTEKFMKMRRIHVGEILGHSPLLHVWLYKVITLNKRLNTNTQPHTLLPKVQPHRILLLRTEGATSNWMMTSSLVLPIPVGQKYPSLYEHKYSF